MAQLSDDCFAFGGPLLTIEAALALMAQRVPVLAGHERLLLDQCDGRVLATDLTARVDVPGFDNSAVDGVAVRFEDLAAKGETRLRLAGRIAAGGSALDISAAGCAVRIFTGAPMPTDADTVFMQEDIRFEADRVVLPWGLKPGANRRKAGEDIAAGAPALAAGRRLLPQDLALAAAVGHPHLDVRVRVRVALMSTGNELHDAGMAADASGGAGIADANRPMLAALLRRTGAQVSDLGIVRDDRAELGRRLQAAAAGHDVIVTTGGVSTGDEDHVKAAVETVGSLTFWRLGIKPGRPVAMGVIDGAAFVGLPGNPVAAFVTFAFVLRPLLARLGGEVFEASRGLPVRVGFRYRKKPDRREFVRVTLGEGVDGHLTAFKFAREGAGVITSLTRTHGLLELADDMTLIEPGMDAPFHAYATLM